MKEKDKESIIEYRTFPSELRVKDDGDDKPKKITGMAAVFGKRSEDLGFIEIIEKGAFKEALKKSDARALYNHNTNILPLGRQSAKTLRLKETDDGLYYEIDPPDTQFARDLQVSIEREDIKESSFGFSIEEDKWERIDGADIRTIKKVKEVFDVSPVVFAAYNDTDVAVRSLEKFREEQKSAATSGEEAATRLNKNKLSFKKRELERRFNNGL